MADKTPLFDAHVAAGGKMVDFAGWMMAVNYGSQIEEHMAVRTAAGVFDVSHMTIVDIDGPDAEAFLRKVIANDVSTLVEYQALYGTALNAHGGILDDLIVYRLPKGYRCVVNASPYDRFTQSIVRVRQRVEVEHRRVDATVHERDARAVVQVVVGSIVEHGYIRATWLAC